MLPAREGDVCGSGRRLRPLSPLEELCERLLELLQAAGLGRGEGVAQRAQGVRVEHAVPEPRRAAERTHARRKRPDRERAQTGLAQSLRGSGDEVARLHACAARELDRLDVVVREQLGAILAAVLGERLDPARDAHVSIDAVRAGKLGVDGVAHEAVDERVLCRTGYRGLPLAA